MPNESAHLSAKEKFDGAAVRTYEAIASSARIMEKRHHIPAWSAAVPLVFVAFFAWKLLRKGVGGFFFRFATVAALGFVGLVGYGAFLEGDVQATARATLGKPLDRIDEARGTVKAAEEASQERLRQLEKIGE